ncbi:MAG TPA: FtsX-like permease family protein, partial [Vicinamibacterales bacterium]
VVGVAAHGFTGLMTPLAVDLWVPIATADALLRPALDPAARLDRTSLHLVGRLKPGVDRTRAGADLDTIGRQLRASAGQPDQGPAVSVYAGTVLHPEIAPAVSVFLAVLMSLVALVLLIVCANVANLVLARAAGRQAELAIRQSLGAGRARLVRQLLTENLMLSLAGAAGGLAIAFWSTRLLMAVQLPTPFPIAFDLALDGRVLAFTIAAAVGATLAFGLVPALGASRIDLVRAIKGMAGDGPRPSRLRPIFLVSQVSLSVLLLVTAGLFVRSFYNAQGADPGFDASHVLVASIDLETRGYTEARGRDFVRTLVERLEAAPGVVSANAVDIVPVTLSNATGGWLREEDAEPAPGQPPPTPEIYMNSVGPGHFSTMNIAMVAGRDFTPQDDAASRGVAIVNETLARRFWPGRSALGQRIRPLGTHANANAIVEIVGVVRDSTYVTVGESARPFLYRPLTQEFTPRVTLLVRSTGLPGAVLPIVRQEVRAMDAGLVVFNVSSLADATAISLVPARIAGDLLAALGLLALALAALGMYGVLSFLVRARSREIGLRVALGATPRVVAGMVVRQAMTWT